MNKIKYLLIIAGAMLLSACASDSKKIVDLRVNYVDAKSAPLGTTNRNAQAQLAEASVQSSQSVNELSAMERALHPDVKLSEPMDPKRLGMTQPTSLDWNGPLEPLLKKIAEASHYKLRIIGKKPGIPIIITLREKDKPMAEIVRNVQYQSEPNATIVLFPGSKTMELRYRSS